MDLSLLTRLEDCAWRLEPRGRMRVPAVIYGDEELLSEMDPRVLDQIGNVAALPGIVGAAYAMPDAHVGYGFPIGGVAAFDPDRGGVVSAGGVGFDISCGVRALTSGFARAELEPKKKELADLLFQTVPAGVGAGGRIRLGAAEVDDMLAGGARWALERGWGEPADLERTEEHGCARGARPEHVSAQAKERQRDQVGTLGSGNHYLEVQVVTEIRDGPTAEAYGLREGEVVVSLHSGSRGLGHQIGTDYLRAMTLAAREHGIEVPERELACAPARSELGERYLGAMRAGINCALANRQVLAHLAREAFAKLFPASRLRVVFDVSHNTCKLEEHGVDGERRALLVHRKGATRALGPEHPDLPDDLRPWGQPVLIGGSMGTASYVLAGTREGSQRSFASACHGAGRSLSRNEAYRRFGGREVVDQLAARGILIRAVSKRGIAEEAPGAYKDVARVVEATERAGLARIVARLEPLVCVKG
jgi:tRNA-splicing ligase RtcB